MANPMRRRSVPGNSRRSGRGRSMIVTTDAENINIRALERADLFMSEELVKL